MQNAENPIETDDLATNRLSAAEPGEYRVATFTADITIPVGHACMGGGIADAKEIVDPLFAKGFVLLEDDKALQPSENIAPAVRSEIIDAYGDDFANALNEVSAKLTTTELIALNKLVGIDGQDPETVAAEWLAAIGVVSE